jgi:hypothetical protein
MTLADVQLLVAHARNEASHPSFKVSTSSVLLRKLLNRVSGIFSTVSCASPVMSLANMTLLKVCLHRPKATQVEPSFEVYTRSCPWESTVSYCWSA